MQLRLPDRPEEALMTALLDYVVGAHGGLNRWNELETVSAHLAQDGVTWEMVGHHMSGSTKAARIMVPTSHRILPRTPGGHALTEPLPISTALSHITFGS